jgi:hypothetical protein
MAESVIKTELQRGAKLIQPGSPGMTKRANRVHVRPSPM